MRKIISHQALPAPSYSGEPIIDKNKRVWGTIQNATSHTNTSKNLYELIDSVLTERHRDYISTLTGLQDDKIQSQISKSLKVFLSDVETFKDKLKTYIKDDITNESSQSHPWLIEALKMSGTPQEFGINIALFAPEHISLEIHHFLKELKERTTSQIDLKEKTKQALDRYFSKTEIEENIFIKGFFDLLRVAPMTNPHPLLKLLLELLNIYLAKIDESHIVLQPILTSRKALPEDTPFLILIETKKLAEFVHVTDIEIKHYDETTESFIDHYFDFHQKNLESSSPPKAQMIQEIVLKKEEIEQLETQNENIKDILRHIHHNTLCTKLALITRKPNRLEECIANIEQDTTLDHNTKLKLIEMCYAMPR